MKKILLSLFVGLIGFISFCNAESQVLVDFGWIGGTTITSSVGQYGEQGKTTCIISSQPADQRGCKYGLDSNNVNTTLFGGTLVCFYGEFYLVCTNGNCSVQMFTTNNILATQSRCESDYSLIPSSVVDSEYCENNNLCSSSSCTGENNWSSLFINDIQHIGGPSIYIGIPEEIERDYSYADNDDMYINVDGYNVDYDKITNIIDTQNYKPTTEDFNYIVSSIIPLFVPGLVIILFLYWIFRFIKKIF